MFLAGRRGGPTPKVPQLLEPGPHEATLHPKQRQQIWGVAPLRPLGSNRSSQATGELVWLHGTHATHPLMWT